MMRKIIHIDEEKCNGCGACADACHEGAIAMVNGRARLMREDYCDGLGDCLPGCPTGAISFEEREAPAYDEAAARAAKAQRAAEKADGRPRPESGCPGSAPRQIPPVDQSGQPRQWPLQLKLAPFHAAGYIGASLLVAADCTAYARAGFYSEFIQNRVVLIGCPKLDAVDYSKKLEIIIGENDIRDITVARMEVPCCGGLEYAVRQALQRSGKSIGCRVVTIGVDGNLAD